MNANTDSADQTSIAYSATVLDGVDSQQHPVASRGGRWIAVGAICGLLAVGFGAFGAHGLEDHFAKLTETDPALAVKRLGNWRTAAQYHMHHSLAIVAAGLLMQSRGGRLAGFAAACFTIGIVIFSGCLYTLVLTEVRVLGAVVPLGGLSFMAGWILMAVAALRDRQPDRQANQTTVGAKE